MSSPFVDIFLLVLV